MVKLPGKKFNEFLNEAHVNIWFRISHSTLLLTVKKPWNYLHYWLVGEETKKVVHTCHGIVCGTEGSADMYKNWYSLQASHVSWKITPKKLHSI